MFQNDLSGIFRNNLVNQNWGQIPVWNQFANSLYGNQIPYQLGMQNCNPGCNFMYYPQTFGQNVVPTFNTGLPYNNIMNNGLPYTNPFIGQGLPYTNTFAGQGLPYTTPFAGQGITTPFGNGINPLTGCCY